LNDLECPIHLKVRFTDGTLDVRTLWLSDSTICTGITREGGGGVGNIAIVAFSSPSQVGQQIG